MGRSDQYRSDGDSNEKKSSSKVPGLVITKNRIKIEAQKRRGFCIEGVTNNFDGTFKMANHSPRERDYTRGRDYNRGAYQDRGRNSDRGRDYDLGGDYDRSPAYGRDRYGRDLHDRDRYDRDRYDRDRYDRARYDLDDRNDHTTNSRYHSDGGRRDASSRFPSSTYSQYARHSGQDCFPPRQTHAHGQMELNHSQSPYPDTNLNSNMRSSDNANPYSSAQYQNIQGGEGTQGRPMTHSVHPRGASVSSYPSRYSNRGPSASRQPFRQASHHQRGNSLRGNASFRDANMDPNNSVANDLGSLNMNNIATSSDPTDLVLEGPFMFGYACLHDQTWGTDPSPPDEIIGKPYAIIPLTCPKQHESIDEEVAVGCTEDDIKCSPKQDADQLMTLHDAQVGDKRKACDEHQSNDSKVRKLDVEGESSTIQNADPVP